MCVTLDSLHGKAAQDYVSILGNPDREAWRGSKARGKAAALYLSSLELEYLATTSSSLHYNNGGSCRPAH